MLPASGQISASAINNELGRSSTATFNIATAENGGYVFINELSTSRPSSGGQAAFSEWHSYNHKAVRSVTFHKGFWGAGGVTYYTNRNGFVLGDTDNNGVLDISADQVSILYKLSDASVTADSDRYYFEQYKYYDVGVASGINGVVKRYIDETPAPPSYQTAFYEGYHTSSYCWAVYRAESQSDNRTLYVRTSDNKAFTDSGLTTLASGYYATGYGTNYSSYSWVQYSSGVLVNSGYGDGC